MRDIKDHTRRMNAALWGAWLRSGVIGVCLFLGILGGSWGMSRNGVKNYSKRARWSRNR